MCLAAIGPAACGSGAGSGGGDGGGGDDAGGSGGPDAGVEPTCDHQDDPSHFNVDVAAITLNGVLTLNGAALPVPEPFGTVSLRNATGDTVVLGTVGDAAYSKTIIPGTYDVYYSWSDLDKVAPAMIALPRNSSVRLQRGVELTSSQTFNVDVSTITLSGTLTINGVVPTAAPGSAQVELRNTATGDKLVLGQLGEATYVTKRIVSGTYDVYYAWTNKVPGNPPIPHNTGALVRTGVVLDSTQTFNVDVPAITLSGKLTVNGVVQSSSPGSQIMLVDPKTNDSIVLGTTGTSAYVPVQVVAGTYSVYYRGPTGSAASLPLNSNARLRAGVPLTATQGFDVDIPSITVSGVITVKGAAVAAGLFSQVTLSDATTGDSLVLGPVGSYTPKQVVPGTYDVYYGWNAADTALPHNSHAKLRTVTLTSTQDLNIDVPAISVSGAITVNGAAPVAATGFAEVSLRNITTGDLLLLGPVGASSYEARQVVPGTYDVYYSWINMGLGVPPVLPHNTSVRVQHAVAIMSDQTLNVDIPATTLSGAITVNGAVQSDATGSVSLVNEGTGDELLIGETSGAMYTPVPAVAGTFDIVYRSSSAGVATPLVPRNASHVLGCTKLVP